MSRWLQRLFTFPQWFIAYRKRKPFTTPFDRNDFIRIKPPIEQFYADPFIIKYEDKNYIFFEEFSFRKRKGHISFVQLGEDGGYSAPQVALERKYHLSYPFIFSWNDKMYMIPESSENETIELYVASNFPCDWKLERVLMRGIKANDTTLWFSDSKVWLFTNIVREGSPAYTNLSLFYADTIDGEWQEHQKNPIVFDVGSARPAGNLFWHEGKIIRPGQNSIIRYGHSLTINAITCLNEAQYSEVNREQIDPSWYPASQSCHTYNGNEDWEVIDGEVIRTDLLKPYRRMAAYIYRACCKIYCKDEKDMI